jgi:hypothetical protein
VAAATPTGEGRAIRVLVAVPVVLLAAIVAGYIALTQSQGGAPQVDVLTVPFVAGYLVLMALLLMISLLDVGPVVRLRPVLRGAPAGGLLILGLMAIFSIGLPILFTAALAVASTIMTVTRQSTGRAVFAAVAAGVGAVVFLLAGLEFTWHYLVCPPTGLGAGTTAGIFVGGYSYECNYGHLTINR